MQPSAMPPASALAGSPFGALSEVALGRFSEYPSGSCERSLSAAMRAARISRGPIMQVALDFGKNVPGHDQYRSPPVQCP
jgi:hypothetical protein